MLNKKFLEIFSYVVLSIFSFIIIVNIGNYIKIRSSEAYDLAKTHIKSHPDLIKKTGEIKEFGKFPSGSIRFENGKTVAQIETKVIGSKLSGKVIVLMEKNNNEDWEYIRIFFNEK